MEQPAMETSVKMTSRVNVTSIPIHRMNEINMSNNFWNDSVSEDDEIFSFMTEAAEDAYYCANPSNFFSLIGLC